MNSKIEALKEAIRHPYCFPGGYSKLVLLSDGEYLCLKCAKNEFRQIVRATRLLERGYNDGWRLEAIDIYWEGPELNCAHCGCRIESEYGDPDCNV